MEVEEKLEVTFRSPKRSPKARPEHVPPRVLYHLTCTTSPFPIADTPRRSFHWHCCSHTWYSQLLHRHHIVSHTTAMPPRKSNVSTVSNGAEDGAETAPANGAKDGMSVEVCIDYGIA